MWLIVDNNKKNGMRVVLKDVYYLWRGERAEKGWKKEFKNK